ncbi:polyketide synthase 12 [Crossiella equi]|uniref:Polyketide synthase 12 n=1 Tax=Crossiella equi TaxID=130796 RepID=A0ABS5A6Y8_9PSEU|nr:type I polyketide synthase [Crossiella equi]MBP2472364.1 polyketide synthase 12 [Crossiella equi]
MADPDKLREYLRMASAELHTLRARVRELETPEPVAVIGTACRYPGGVRTLADLWRVVEDGVDTTGEFPTDRGWRSTGRGAFLDDAAAFDPAFFGVSPLEAKGLDPQQRLALELSWEALEDAGIVPDSLRGGPVGVYLGAAYQGYDTLAEDASEVLFGNLSSVISGRVAYTLGLSGPVLTVDTACSSSLVAVHLACTALRRGECDTALAGGVSVQVLAELFTEFARQQGLSADGRCRAFAEQADGTGFAEGAGVLVLRRLSDVGHEDRVLALLRGSAVNSDGASNGLTAPSRPAQERVIRAALADAGLSTSDIDLVEGHGTGTKLGDPIEIGALAATYGSRGDGRPVWLGSVKSNLGHTQAAAGVAGVLKVIAALREGLLPQSLHAEQPTGRAEWGGVRLLSQARPWPELDRPRRAGVSAFGASGTNAHVIVEQAPARTAAPEVIDPAVLPFVLSGRTAADVRAQAERLRAHVEAAPGLSLSALARSLVVSRTVFDHRTTVVAHDRAELLALLTACAQGEPHAQVVTGQAFTEKAPVFVFPGQGSQWLGMGLALWEQSPEFAASMTACAQAFAAHVDWDLRTVLADADQLARVDVVQPALFAVLVSLAQVWRAHGVAPGAVVGHSQGEIAAAHVAGALSLEDAARVVCLRSRLIAQRLAGLGGMASVPLPLAEAQRLAEPHGLSVAAVNGPASIVLAGPAEGIAALVAADERVRRIDVDYASHSAYVEEIREELLEVLAPIRPRTGTVPLYSAVTGKPVDGTGLDARYWFTNLRQRVDFAGAVAALSADGFDVFAELSPHPVLTTAVEHTVTESAPDSPVATTGTLRRDAGGTTQLLQSLAVLHAAGCPVDLSRAWPEGTPLVPLPTYAFAHERYWLEGRRTSGDPASVGLTATGHPLLGAATHLPSAGRTVLSGSLSPATLPWLADHEVHGSVLLPGAAFVELAVRAGDEVDRPVLAELTVHAPLVLPGGGAVAVQVAVDGEGHAQIHSRTGEGSWTHHADAVLTAEPVPAAELTWPPAGEAVDTGAFYDTLAADGLRYGPAFQGVRAVWRSGNELYAEVALPEQVTEGGYVLHPALLDAALQVVAFGAGERGRAVLPFAWTGVTAHAQGARALRVRITVRDNGDLALTATDPGGRPVLTVGALRSRPVNPGQLGGTADLLSTVDWQPVAAGTGEPVPHTVHEARTGTPLEVATDVLAAVQDWLAVDRGEALLVVLTRGAVEPVTDPAQAAAWGLVRAAQAEHPGRLLLVDADGPGLDWLPRAVATGEPQLAVRAGAFLAPRLVPAESTGGFPAVPEGGAVVVTGGTGGLGALVARHLATEHGVRHLVLLSRTGQAPELAGELTALGVRVDVRACDVSDREQLRAALAGVPVAGVVHAAAALDDGVVTALNPDRLATAFAAKANGARHLDELTREHDLAFFALFSSAAGVLGSPGQAGYAAANTYLDALAAHRRARGLPAHSLAWGLWAQGTGLTAPVLGTRAEAPVRPLSTAEGLALFDRVLSGGPALTVPARRTAPARRAARPTAGAVATDTGFATRVAGLAPAERKRELLRLVRDHAAALLGFGGRDEVDPRRTFLKSGFDSLTSVELRNRLSASTGLRLPPTAVFDFPTPDALAAKLAEDLAPAEDTAPEHELLAALDRVEAALRGEHTDEALRAALTERLTGLARPGGEDTAALHTADADELFAFIHDELGMGKSE